MKTTLAYLRRIFLLDIQQTLAYPASFWTVAITTPLFTLISLVFLEVIYGQTTTFLGYSRYEAYVLFGTFSLVQAIGHFYFFNRLIEFKRMVSVGSTSTESFDSVLTKPVDSQIIGTLGKLSLGNISPMIVSLGVVLYGLLREPHAIPWSGVVTYLLGIVLGVIIFYLLFLVISTVLFWHPQLRITDALADSLYAFGQYPSGLYQGGLSILFNLFLPLTLMASIPVEFLFGERQPIDILLYLALVLGLCLLARRFWQFAIKRYSSFSS